MSYSLLNAALFVEQIEKASWHLDQPLNHPNSIGLLFLTKYASEYVKVLLSGEGADESMGGYARYFYALIRPWVRPGLPLWSRLPWVGQRLQHRFGSERDPISWFIQSSAFLTD